MSEPCPVHQPGWADHDAAAGRDAPSMPGATRPCRRCGAPPWWRRTRRGCASRAPTASLGVPLRGGRGASCRYDARRLGDARDHGRASASRVAGGLLLGPIGPCRPAAELPGASRPRHRLCARGRRRHPRPPQAVARRGFTYYDPIATPAVQSQGAAKGWPQFMTSSIFYGNGLKIITWKASMSSRTGTDTYIRSSSFEY